MIGFTAFKTRKPRSFDYRPRYFDPEQEAREARKKELLGDSWDNDPDAQHPDAYTPGQYVRALRIRRGTVASGRSQGKQRVGMIRIIIFVLFLAAILWFIFS